ncbi:MAG TPA: DegT/DnrJ/EryC1/StrS family aminotransferase [Saprospiraceae bacterium]|nr:DegT/DnrJ/EryC1/StrS family aminotransferase [Saprospiraceae bacterium]HND88786.1 DegT/DnrJ/EryC1/StrS family aminotransferase [Saprospiraceae bacterium]
MINVTKPYLPAYADYAHYLEGIWQRNWLTNNGPLVNELELQLKDYLGLEHFLFLSNGTIAIQMAIKALELKGEIITTPFSYVATTSSIVWEGCTPVFVDIDPNTLNLDPALIEAAITKKTSAILATHVYGNPCDIDGIQAVADKHKLKVIYDAAHCFGTRYKGRSVFNYGDVSTSSFHATKLFHTVEGGCVCTTDAEITRRLSLLRNFGHTSPVEFDGVGINAKNSEFHAAMGLAMLKEMESIRARRKEQWLHYQKLLAKAPARTIKIDAEKTEFNYAYFPLIFETESQLLKSMEALNVHAIYPRRYFYPSLNRINYVNHIPCPVSEDVAPRVLCLPLYHQLSREEQEMIVRILLRTFRY